jgi:caa(3)-type oxidase subunit IV
MMMSHAKATTTSEHPPSHSSVGLYLGRYLFLLVLLAAMVAFMALAFASVKAWLEAMNFMHLRESLRLTWLIAAGTVPWLAVLIVGRLMDLATRTPTI